MYTDEVLLDDLDDELDLSKNYRFCGNLGCTEYNKRYGGRLNAKTLRNEKKHEEKKEKDVT